MVELGTKPNEAWCEGAALPVVLCCNVQSTEPHQIISSKCRWESGFGFQAPVRREQEMRAVLGTLFALLAGGASKPVRENDIHYLTKSANYKCP